MSTLYTGEACCSRTISSVWLPRGVNSDFVGSLKSVFYPHWPPHIIFEADRRLVHPT